MLRRHTDITFASRWAIGDVFVNDDQVLQHCKIPNIDISEAKALVQDTLARSTTSICNLD